mgnify:FL=1
MILMLLSVNSVLTLINAVFILLQISSGRSGQVITAYRPSLVVDKYTVGGSIDFILFVLFLFGVYGINIALSAKIYSRHRSYSLAVLGLGTLICVLSIIVSFQLLTEF